ncbi:MAG: ABC transporter substrate-binding protein [Candidatus Bathyarchaeia archaeon]
MSSAVKKSTVAAIVAVLIVAAVVGVYFMWPKPSPVVTEIKIGVNEPLTGAAADTGLLALQGMRFAVDEINAAGGVKSLGGINLTLVISDCAGDPKTGALETERLITTENVVAVLGSYFSSVTKTASEVAESYEVPFLNPDSISPSLTQRGFKWFFRTTPTDVHLVPEAFKYLDWLKTQYPGQINTIGVLHEDSEWGASWWELIKNEAPKHGYSIVVEVKFKTGATSLDSEVLAVKEKNPDVLFQASYTTDTILLLNTIKRLNYAPKLMIGAAGIEQPYTLEATKELSHYQHAITKFCWDFFAFNEKVKAKNEAFKKKFNKDLGEVAVRGYVAVYTMYYAIEEAGKTASPSDLKAFRTAIRDALKAIDIGKEPAWMIAPWDGVKFDENGDNIRARGIIVQVMPEDTKHHTVWPRELATEDPIFPMPPWEQR